MHKFFGPYLKYLISCICIYIIFFSSIMTVSIIQYIFHKQEFLLSLPPYRFLFHLISYLFFIINKNLKQK